MVREIYKKARRLDNERVVIQYMMMCIKMAIILLN